MSVFDRKELPKTVRGQKHRIFANIKSIFNLHEHEFMPRLIQCSDEPERIAEVFTSFISRDFFYGYIIYAINRKRSEQLCNYNGEFWKVRHFIQLVKCNSGLNLFSHERPNIYV